jgi:hypothetical protein
MGDIVVEMEPGTFELLAEIWYVGVPGTPEYLAEIMVFIWRCLVLWKLKIVHDVSQRAVKLNNAAYHDSGERKSQKSEDDECGSGLGSSSVSYKNNVRKQLDFDTFTGLF